MLPILLQLGPIKIYSMGVMMLLAWVVGIYWWWKMGRDENWEETVLFDAYFGAMAGFYVVARVVYVWQHYQDLASWSKALAVLAYPGLNYLVGVVGAILIVLKVAKSKGWDLWRVGDILAVTVSLMLVWGRLGVMLNEEANWVNLVKFIWMMMVFGLVTVVRKNFRFYSWYKGESSVAKDGLAVLIGSLMLGLEWLVLVVWKQDWKQLGLSLIVELGLILVVLLRADKLDKLKILKRRKVIKNEVS